jgi:uncharacterized protein (TIGR03118 family)
MRQFTRDLQPTVLEGKHLRRSRARRPAVEGLEERALLSAAHDLLVHKHFAVPDQILAAGYKQTNLVSDIAGLAQITDPSLVNPWDVNFPQLPKKNPPVWVSDQGTGVATQYKTKSTGHTVEKSPPFTVTIPTAGITTPTGPTGVVFNAYHRNFSIPGPHGTSVSATYIFATLQGTIEGWNKASKGGSSSAEIVVKSSAEYTGLASGAFLGQHYIYAANDIASPGIDVYNSSFQLVKFPNSGFSPSFFDPDLPTGFTPYSVRDLPNDLYVMYRGPEFIGGAVAEFSNDGTFIRQIASDTTSSGNLQTPSGLAYINRGFGEFSNDLLVSNFSTGQIDAYNLDGQFLRKVLNTNGTPLTIPGLRSIHFGPGPGSSGPKAALLFTAGTDGTPGLYGMIMPAT